MSGAGSWSGIMWFRVLLSIVTLAGWGLFLWMAGHRSDSPSVLGLYSKGYTVLLAALLGLALLATAAHARVIYRRLFARRYPIAVTVLSTILSLAFVEVLVRVLNPLGISYYRESARYHLDKIPDPDLVFAHRPGLQGVYMGVPVSINDLGMRDRPVPPKAPGEFRILLLGDSVTFGSGTRVEDIFARKLESRLSSRLAGPVRTINTGVGGYNSEQELGVLQKFGERLTPDLVLLLYVPNDVDKTPSKPFDPWTERSVTKAAAPEAIMLLLGKSWTYRLMVHALQLGQGGASALPQRESAGWKNSLTSVSRMAEYCRAHSLPFALFYYRQIRSPQNDALAEDLAALAAREKIPFRDILPWFDGTKPREVTISVVDSHPNAKGHELLAKGMEDALAEWGLLPVKN